MRNAHVFLCKDKTLFVISQSIVRSENSLPFLCRSFTLKDNHFVLKVYEFLGLELGLGLELWLRFGLGLGLCLGLGLGLGLGLEKKECS